MFANNSAMSGREELSQIRIVNVTDEGQQPGFGSLMNNITKANSEAFIAIDAEFSGLSHDRCMSEHNLANRYAAIKRVADTRAIYSVGFSVFNPVGKDKNGKEVYEVATYDVLMNCQDDFSTNAMTGAFLVTHGFNFERMFKKGVPYIRASTEKGKRGKCDINLVEGNDQKGDDEVKDDNTIGDEDGKKSEKSGKEGQNKKQGDVSMGEEIPKSHLPFQYGKLPRGLLWRIGRKNIPLVVHNGLLDLAFMFAAFQAPLADTLNGFIEQLLDTVPGGYFDTKMLANVIGEHASFLGYLQAKAVSKEVVSVRNTSGLPLDSLTDPPLADSSGSEKFEMCALYGLRGFCPRGLSCPFSHDPFLVVEEEKKGNLSKDNKEAYKKLKAQSKALKRKRTKERKQLLGLSKKQRKKVLGRRVEQPRQRMESTGLDGDPMDKELTSLAIGGSREVKPSGELGEESRMIDEDCSKEEETGNGNEGKLHTAGWDAFCTGYVYAVCRASASAELLEKKRNIIWCAKKNDGLLLGKSDFADLDILPATTTEGSKSEKCE